ncbi:MAG: tetratricopeptide repeat protein [Kiritimatiellia bacterium]
MQWFYIKHGSFHQRGVATWDQLEKLVHSGEIQDSDLIYSEGTNYKWVRASSIPGLFRSKDGRGTGSAPAVPAASPGSQPLTHQARFSRRNLLFLFRAFVVALGIVLLASITSAIRGVSRRSPPEPPIVITEEPVASWQSVESDVRGLLQSGQLLEAGNIINRYIDDMGTNEISIRLTQDLQLRRKQTRFSELYGKLRVNRANNDDMVALASLAEELGRTETLVNTLKSALVGRPPPSPAMCRSIMSLGRILQHRELQLAALDTLGRTFDSASPYDCLALVELYIAYQMPDEAVALLEAFTEAHPDAFETWLELAALLALQEQADAALAALKEAVQTGGDEAREKAREDVRFDFVRRTWSFRWQTR